MDDHQLAVNQVVTDRGLCCVDCGHPTYFHRETSHSQSSAPDDPTPCAAALYTFVPGIGHVFSRFCLCTTVHLLKDEQP